MGGEETEYFTEFFVKLFFVFFSMRFPEKSNRYTFEISAFDKEQGRADEIFPDIVGVLK